MLTNHTYRRISQGFLCLRCGNIMGHFCVRCIKCKSREINYCANVTSPEVRQMRATICNEHLPAHPLLALMVVAALAAACSSAYCAATGQLAKALQCLAGARVIEIHPRIREALAGVANNARVIITQQRNRSI